MGVIDKKPNLWKGPKYTELYVNSYVGELTLETSDYQVTDHTQTLEDSGECRTTVDLQKQIDLGKITRLCVHNSNRTYRLKL